MIGPNMATMLAFVLTDAAVAAGRPAATLAAGRGRREPSTASASRGTPAPTTRCCSARQRRTARRSPGDDLARFRDGGHERVRRAGAQAIAADAEGAKHLVTIDVEGCRTDAEAQQIAKTVADSALVKTAIFGADPNWGRIVSAAGYAGVAFEEARLVAVDGRPVAVPGRRAAAVRRGRGVGVPEATTARSLRLRFTLGAGRCTFYTCDLTYEYVG